MDGEEQPNAIRSQVIEEYTLSSLATGTFKVVC